VDDCRWACLPDSSGWDFFLYDLSWFGFCSGVIDVETIHKETGVLVRDLRGLSQAMEGIFAKYASCAVAVKTQHAYRRTLAWRERAEGDVEQVFQKRLTGKGLTEEETLCLGDWCLARGLELAIEYNLPFKIHTGYLVPGQGSMEVDRLRSGHLSSLLIRYPRARFVLMHIAYPYSDELVALAKHFPNVYVDLCWAWAIDPFSACDFVRRMIHAVPAHKLFAFGGDTHWPNATLAYAIQARQWLTRALQAEVEDGLLTEARAMALATRMMRTNQEECFDLEGCRTAIQSKMREPFYDQGAA
jgi:predicted TIM-barrel fold metal-dependent hydrolase